MCYKVTSSFFLFVFYLVVVLVNLEVFAYKNLVVYKLYGENILFLMRKLKILI